MTNDYVYQEPQITHQSLIDRINKEQQESNELRIKLECMKQLYISLASLYHDHEIIFNTRTKHTEIWNTCNAISCQSARDSMDKLGLKWR